MKQKNPETIELTTPQQHVLLARLNRPDSANAFNTLMAHELVELFEDLALDPGEHRCVVITGAGDRAFCAGADLRERKGMSEQQWHRQHLVYERMIRAIVNCPLPVIAAVNGAAYAGGCEIAAATDFIYAADSARFAQTETTLGIIPGAGGTQNLARAIGERRAKEIILSGVPFSADDALQWGLVNKLFPREQLLAETIGAAARIAENAPIAVRQAKQAIYRGFQMSLADGLAFEIEAYNRTINTEDRHEGINAFNEKRKPRFKGR